MMTFIEIFQTFRKFGITLGIWAVIRVLILPYKKINDLVPVSGHIIDIGCGSGAFTYFLSLKSKSRNITGIDLSEKRIKIAKKIQKFRKKLNFIYGDSTKLKINSVNCYLIVDVLHHISYQNQIKLLKHVSSKLKKDGKLIIKEVDNSNKLPFLFGHFWEKILYPKETIYVRSKKDWLKIIKELNLNCKTYGGSFYFPDSTVIFECVKNK